MRVAWPARRVHRYRRGVMADEPTSDVRSDAEVRDELPEDLNASEFVGPYVFPNNNRRRIPGYLYLALGVACLAAWALTGTGAGVLVNGGFLGAGILLVLLGRSEERRVGKEGGSP